MRIDYEEQILRNPAFGAVLIWQFARAYFKVDTRSPSIAHLALAMPMALHRPTVRRVHRMNFGSGLLHAVASSVDITSDLQQRTEQTCPMMLRSLATASASALVAVRRHSGSLPEVTPTRFDNLRALESTEDSTAHMVDTARRLGIWFAKMPLHDVAALLRVRL